MILTSIVEKRNHTLHKEYEWGVTQNGMFYPFGDEELAKLVAEKNEDLSTYCGFPLADCLLAKES